MLDLGLYLIDYSGFFYISYRSSLLIKCRSCTAYHCWTSIVEQLLHRLWTADIPLLLTSVFDVDWYTIYSLFVTAPHSGYSAFEVLYRVGYYVFTVDMNDNWQWFREQHFVSRPMVFSIFSINNVLKEWWKWVPRSCVIHMQADLVFYMLFQLTFIFAVS